MMNPLREERFQILCDRQQKYFDSQTVTVDVNSWAETWRVARIAAARGSPALMRAEDIIPRAESQYSLLRAGIHFLDWHDLIRASSSSSLGLGNVFSNLFRIAWLGVLFCRSFLFLRYHALTSEEGF
jgi:hypothetical protein